MRRNNFIEKLDYAFEIHNIVAIIGPQQCGKTTIAKEYFAKAKSNKINYFDLENPRDLSRLENPMLALEELAGLIVIDEIQHSPNLFKTLRYLIDNNTNNQQYLVLGSASGELLNQSAESLAGRISYMELTPFCTYETFESKILWHRGGYPRSYLAKNDNHSMIWRQQYIKTFLEIDVPRLGINISTNNIRRFWYMLADYHGNIFNASEIGKPLGLSNQTVSSYLEILNDTMVIRSLKPWFENINKHQVKSPKIYFRDSGLFHTIIGVGNDEQLKLSTKLGASWEGFVIEEIIRKFSVDEHDCYFWGTHSGAELDLIIIKDGKKHFFEIKYQDKVKATKPMYKSIESLNIDQLNVIIPGNDYYKLDDNIAVCGFDRFIDVNT